MGVCLLTSYIVMASAVVSIVIVAMSEQIVPRVIVQVHALIKFLANKNVKAVEILCKPCLQFGEETLLKVQVRNGTRYYLFGHHNDYRNDYREARTM